MEIPPFIEFVADELHEIHHLHTRRMFGGVGLYCSHRMFGLIYDEKVYLKTCDGSRDRYIQTGMSFFGPTQNQSLRCYYEVPSAVIENKEEFLAWAHDAVEID